jgi:hypothetical protein
MSEHEREFENRWQELDEKGYVETTVFCPDCGCFVMEKESAVNTDPEGDGEILEIDRVCPCCEWWEISYDG